MQCAAIDARVQLHAPASLHLSVPTWLVQVERRIALSQPVRQIPETNKNWTEKLMTEKSFDHSFCHQFFCLLPLYGP